MYKLKYRRKARNYLAQLPLKIKTDIVNKLHKLCLDPESSSLDIDVLKGGKGFRATRRKLARVFGIGEESFM